MLWKKYWYKWQETSIWVYDNTIDYTRNWITWISSIDWKILNTKENKLDYKGTHWSFVSPTLAHWRYIRIEWVVRGETREYLLEAMNYIESLFVLQSYTYETELNRLEFVDEQDLRWYIDCKVRTPVSWDFETDDSKDWTIRRYKVELFAPIPYIYSVDDLFVDFIEWDYWGVKLWTKLWAKFDKSLNKINCKQTAWNFQSATIWEIDIIEDCQDIFIYNVDTNSKFYMKWNFISWDHIEIDWWNMMIYKNWYRLDWVLTDDSLFPVVDKESNFIVRDKYSMFYDWKMSLQWTVIFKNVML